MVQGTNIWHVPLLGGTKFSLHDLGGGGVDMEIVGNGW